MTQEEGCVLTAFTGRLLVEFPVFHKWVETQLGRPVMTSELPQLQARLAAISSQRANDIVRNQSAKDNQ
jgi:hypothetical protein